VEIVADSVQFLHNGNENSTSTEDRGDREAVPTGVVAEEDIES
jgi:hypothetical protein